MAINLQLFQTQDSLEIGNYSLTLLRCRDDNESIRLFDELRKEVISELFEEDKGLGEIYKEYKRGDYSKEGLEIFLRFYFESNKNKAQKMISEV